MWPTDGRPRSLNHHPSRPNMHRSMYLSCDYTENHTLGIAIIRPKPEEPASEAWNRHPIHEESLHASPPLKD